MEKNIEEVVKKFFTLMQLEINSLSLSIEENNIYNVKIDTPDSWILIWPHWKNLDFLHSFLRSMISKLVENKVSVHIEVNDYMKSKDEKLFGFIKSKIKSISKGWDVCLPFLNSYERKKVHSFIADLNDDTLSTKSVWEWKDRRLHICKTWHKLSIDIDWDDI